MKKKIFISLQLVLLMLVFTTCKKEHKNDGPINWAEELKGSVWAGEFSYNAGNGLVSGIVQPFSIVCDASANVFNWYDVTGIHPGTYQIQENKITMKFNSGGHGFTASMTKDSWNGFINNNHDSWKIQNIFRSAIPNAEKLTGSHWATADSYETIFWADQMVTPHSAQGFKFDYKMRGAGAYSEFDFLNGTIKDYVIFTGQSKLKGVTYAYNLGKLFNATAYEATRQ